MVSSLTFEQVVLKTTYEDMVKEVEGVGKTLSEQANKLNVSINTVRNFLKYPHRVSIDMKCTISKSLSKIYGYGEDDGE